MAESKELAVVTNNYAVRQFSAADISELMTENLGPGGLSIFDLDHVKIPTGGSTTWIIPGLEGEEETKAIDCVCVLWQTTRAYWAQGFEQSGGGTPPDCFSEDGIHCIKRPGYDGPGGGDCATCPLNQWGSAPDGVGKACKEKRHLFVLRENSILPTVVDAAPASLQPMRQFFLRLVSRGIPYYGAKMRLELEKDRNGNGIAYAKIKPTLLERLSPEEVKFFKQYSQDLKASVGKLSHAMSQADVTIE